MSNLLNTGSLPKGLWPGVKASFGNTHKELPTEYDKVFVKQTSDKAYEEIVSVSPFGNAIAKPEGQTMYYDSYRQGFITRLTNVTYALGFMITLEEIEDGKFLPEAPKRAEALARSFRNTKEQVAGLVLSRAFTGGYTGGDGSILCVTSHANKAGGTWSNALAVPADLSEAAVEQLVSQIMNATDDRGKRILLMPKALVVDPAGYWDAERIVKSVQSPGNANNAINVIKANNIFPDGVAVNRFYDAGNGAWFITTDAPEGMIYQERSPLKFGQDNDSDTQNVKFFGTERYTFGWGDPRGIYGSAGAA